MVVFEKTKGLTDNQLHYCPGCTHGIIHRLVAEALEDTTVTILMMIPTLVTSMFGMNLINGMESKPWGFILAVIISVAISAIAWGIFRHKRLV